MEDVASVVASGLPAADAAPSIDKSPFSKVVEDNEISIVAGKVKSLDESADANKGGEKTSLLDAFDVAEQAKEIVIGHDGKVVGDTPKKSFSEMTLSEIKAFREETADRVLISAVKTICTL